MHLPPYYYCKWFLWVLFYTSQASLPRKLRLVEEVSPWSPCWCKDRRSRGMMFLPFHTHILTLPHRKENFKVHYTHHLHLKSSTYSHLLMLFRKCSWLEQNSCTELHKFMNAFHPFSKHKFSSTSISVYSRQIPSVISLLTRSKDISSVASSSAIHGKCWSLSSYCSVKPRALPSALLDGDCCISNSCETILNKEKAATPFSSQHMAFLQVIHRLFIGK